MSGIEGKVSIAKNLNTKYYKQGCYDLNKYHSYSALINEDVCKGIVKMKYDVIKEKVRVYNKNGKRWEYWW